MRVFSVQLKEFSRMERSEPIMSETHPPRRIGQSIVAVIAGMLVGIVITLGTDVVLHAVGVFPPWGASMVGFDGPLLLATAYRTVYGVLGSYIIARLAPDRPMQQPWWAASSALW
jgi:Mn2+/Fe2+ NRAMP family transporter